MNRFVARIRGLFRALVLMQVERIRALMLAKQQRAYEILTEKEHELHARYLYLRQRSNRVEDYLQRQEHSVHDLTKVFSDASSDLLDAENKLRSASEKISMHNYLRKYA